MRTLLILFTTVIALLGVFVLIVAAGLHQIRAGKRAADQQWAHRDQTPKAQPPPASRPSTAAANDNDPIMEPPRPEPIVLLGLDARLHGRGFWNTDGLIEDWKDPAGTVEWFIPRSAPGAYRVELTYALGVDAPRKFSVTTGWQSLEGEVTFTKEWNQFATLKVGTIKLDGRETSLRMKFASGPQLDHSIVRLRMICLIPPGMTVGDPALTRIVLSPADAELHGQHIKLSNGPEPRIMNWTLPTDTAEWAIRVPMSRNYRMFLTLSNADSTGGDFSLTINRDVYHCHAGSTGNFDAPKRVPLGLITLPGGKMEVTIRPDGEFRNALMNLWSVEFEPE